MTRIQRLTIIGGFFFLALTALLVMAGSGRIKALSLGGLWATTSDASTQVAQAPSAAKVTVLSSLSGPDIRPLDELPGDVAREVRCLALNIYFEARSEPLAGQIAVAHVVLNRVAARAFPATICDVVQQGGEVRRNRCQFSWWCDGRSDQPREARAWSHSVKLAQLIYYGTLEDPTEGAKWYHTSYVRPSWRKALTPARVIGQHIFYQESS